MGVPNFWMVYLMINIRKWHKWFRGSIISGNLPNITQIILNIIIVDFEWKRPLFLCSCSIIMWSYQSVRHMIEHITVGNIFSYVNHIMITASWLTHAWHMIDTWDNPTRPITITNETIPQTVFLSFGVVHLTMVCCQFTKTM